MRNGIEMQSQLEITQAGFDAFEDYLEETENPFKAGTVCSTFWEQGWNMAFEGEDRP